MMEPILVSNQVYEAIQTPTLEEPEPLRSTILYANRYSGIDEVDMTDPELVDLINSTIGLSGSNVLIQLKQKMEKFRNGPWFIDSKNGVVYIHNRKLSQESVKNYIYQQENGELLSVSFSMVEVYKPLAGLSNFVSGVTKAVNSVTAHLQDVVIDLEMKIDKVKSGDNTHEPDKTRVDNNRAFYTVQGEYEATAAAKRREAAAQKKAYDAKSPEQLKAERDSRTSSDYSTVKKGPTAMKIVDEQLSPQFDYWKKSCQYFGKNSPEANKAYDEMMEEAKNVHVEVGRHEDILGEYEAYVYTGDIKNTREKVSPKEKPGNSQTAVSEWKEAHPDCIVTGSRYTWKYSGIESIQLDPQISAVQSYYKWKGVVIIKYFGKGSRRSVIRADKLLKDVFPRYDSSNLTSTLQNAAANLGRSKKEKKLQATMRVVGNPSLESMQQIGVYNVGNKYSGDWYIKSVDHSFEFGQGYICEITLTKQLPKHGATGETSVIDTKGFSSSIITSTSGKKGGVGTTKGKPDSSPTVATDNYIKVGNWTVAEIQSIAQTIAYSSSDAQAEYRTQEFVQGKYRNEVMNKRNGTNNPYVTMERGRDGSYSYSVRPTDQNIEIPKRLVIPAGTWATIVDTANEIKSRSK